MRLQSQQIVVGVETKASDFLSRQPDWKKNPHVVVTLDGKVVELAPRGARAFAKALVAMAKAAEALT